MTIGDKIRYLRTRMGITQGELADLSGIHPVSIRKYETNKMTPQAQQIERIAEALGVSSFAISGIENNIRLETKGDFMGLLLMLIKTNLLVIKGDRGEDDGLIPETVSFEINSFVSKFYSANANSTDLNAESITFKLKSDAIFQDILKWEKITYGYEKSAAKYGDTNEQAILDVMNEMKDYIEAIEMELQRSGAIPK